MRHIAVMAGCLALLVPSASACLNDIELPQHEREFRSQYLAPEFTGTRRAHESDPTQLRWLTWSGYAMLLTSVALIASGRRPGS